MTLRALAVLWLVVGVALWNRMFDLHIDRGVSQYLHLRAEYELGLGPEPSMAAVMGRAERLGVRSASLWAAGLVGCGWLTMALVARGGARSARGTGRRLPQHPS